MKRLVLLLAATALVVAGCASSGGGSSQPRDLSDHGGGTFQGAGLSPAQPRPAFTLTDTHGESFDFFARTTKAPTLLYFGYTNCPDVCPTTMADIGQALAALPSSLAAKTNVVFVTTDVKRDTGPVIAKWLSNFQALAHGRGNWIGLRGTQNQIDTAEASAHVMLAQDGGQQHSAEALLYGPDNYAHVLFLQSTKLQEQIQHDLPLVAKGVS